MGCGTSPHILNLHLRYKKMVRLSASSVLLPGKSPRYQLNGRLGGPQNRFGHFGEDENPLPALNLNLHSILLRITQIEKKTGTNAANFYGPPSNFFSVFTRSRRKCIRH